MKQWAALGLILFLFLPSSSGDTSQLELQFLGIDDFNEVNSGLNDLKRVWVGEDSDKLFFITQLHSNTSAVAVNYTILTESNDKFLISAYIQGDQYSLYISHATSLISEAQIPSGETVITQYIEKRIFFNPIRLEIGFYIDWADIGGQSEIDIVGWTDAENDKIPNTSFFTYNGVANVDRVLDFDAAMSGAFETWFEASDFSTELTPSTMDKPTTSTPTPPSTNPPNNSSIAIVLILLVLAFLKIRENNSKKKNFQNRQIKKQKATSNWKPETAGQQMQMTFVDQLNREVRACCFQTARTGDQYCYCGRAVDPDVMALFD